MKKIIILIMIFCGLSLVHSQQNPLTLEDPAVRTLYIQMLEDYIFKDYTKAWDLNNILLNYDLDEASQKKLKMMREILNVQLARPLTPQEIEERKKFDEGLIYYWVKNILYHTAAFNTLPNITGLEYNTQITSLFTLTGLGSGIASSILTMKNSKMNWGRAIAIDFYTIWAGLNTQALLRVLFYPDQTAAYADANAATLTPYRLINSPFPSAFSDADFSRLNMAMIDTISLTARYIAIFKTKDQQLSAGRYSLLLNAYGWGTFISSTILNVLENRPLFSSVPNPYNFFTASVLADLGLLALDRAYDKLQWEAPKVWRASTLGMLGLGLGTALSAAETNQWVGNNRALVSALWGISGISFGLSLSEMPGNRGQDAMVLNSYLWTSFISYAFLYELSGNNLAHTLISPVLGNTTSILVSRNYSYLDWSPPRTWLVSLSGVIGIITGALVNSIVQAQWMGEHPLVSAGIWSTLGLTLGTVFTRNMPTYQPAFIPQPKDWGIQMAMMPRLGLGNDLGVDILVYKDF